jgi:hypothetical protein
MDNSSEQNAVTKWEWVPAHPELLPKKLRTIPPPPPPPQRPRRLFVGLLMVVLALGSSAIYLLWASMQQEREARQQALERQQAWELEWRAQQQRQVRAMESLMQQIEIATAQPELPPESPLPPQSEVRKPTPSQVVSQQPTPAIEAPPSVPAELPKPLEPPQEPKSKERVKMELSPEVEALSEDGLPKRKRGLAKFLTSSIFVDSAVLTTSLLVPPSIPLTLAQSRLGRRLTGRVLKKTKTDKTLTAKVVRDVGDMPITQRRRR